MIGRLLRFSLFGESHGRSVGVQIDGVPPGIKIEEKKIMTELERRKGIPELSTKRKETDRPEFLSGVFKGYTTGGPVVAIAKNKDVDSSYYEKIRNIPRPGHSDYSAYMKYFGFNDYRGGGMFSGRLTFGIVVAGYFAREILAKAGIRVKAYAKSIGNIKTERLSLKDVFESNNPYCPDDLAYNQMLELIKKTKDEGDSVGGIVESIALDVPPGLGGFFEDDLEANLSKAFFMIPAVKGVEFGLGFKASELKGSEANDPFAFNKGKVVTKTNNCGGILGGISDGMPIIARVAFKPTSSIFKEQDSVDLQAGKDVKLNLKGRFDPCIVPKAIPVVEAMMSFSLADSYLRWLSWKEFKNLERK
jgi:chorismate synthase